MARGHAKVHGKCPPLGDFTESAAIDLKPTLIDVLLSWDVGSVFFFPIHGI